jgi:serine/threonine protein kinase
VKAANILLTEEATIKIADFGVSATLGKTTGTIGTPLWMVTPSFYFIPHHTQFLGTRGN